MAPPPLDDTPFAPGKMEPVIATLERGAAVFRPTDAPPLKILILDDSPVDAELMTRELCQARLEITPKRVDTKEGFEEALDTFAPDVVLLDVRLPGYDGADALKYERRVHPEIPVVVVTGTIGDEAAINLLRAGAKEYVLKDNLLRLAPAVERAITLERGIRARKAAERELRAANHMLHTTERIAQMGGFSLDVANKTLVWSEELFRIHGRAVSEGPPPLDWFLASVHADDRQRVGATLAATTRNEAPFDIEFRIIRPDGAERVLRARAEADCDGAGNPVQIHGTAQDITESKRAEENLRASEERFRMLVEQAPEAILIYDLDQDRFIDANRRAELLFGCGRAELVKYGPQHFYLTAQPDRRPVAESFQAHNAQAAQGEIIVFERRIRAASGDERICEVTLVPLPSVAGRLLRSSFIDVTARRAAETGLRRTLRALKALSGGNEVLVRATSEAELLDKMCHVVVEHGGYHAAWVGVPQDDAEKSFKVANWAGEEQGTFTRLQLSWGDGAQGQSPTGRTIRSGQPEISQDIASDPREAPWAAVAAQYGVASVAALPLKDDAGIFAALTIYATEPNAFDADEVKLLQELANDLAFGIRTLRGNRQREELEQRWRASLESTIGAIASTVEMRDPYTAGHQRRVATLAVAIARRLSMTEHDIHGIYLAGIIHDVGKINIPSEILNKPGKLSKIEFQLIQAHAQSGYDIIKGVNFPWPIAQMVLQHHERLDGSGYPQGLKGETILAEAKILAVADVVEAMMSHRPYRPALGIDAALAEIEKGRGTLYDRATVDACRALFHDGDFNFD